MNLLEFIEKFPNEESCKSHFIQQRIKKGVTCKKCGNETHYWLKNKEQFECKSCHFRTTLTSGTVMHSSKLPFRYWYISMHLLTATKKGFSAHELKRQLGHKRYQPIWEMLKKIRTKMGEADNQVKLDGMIEIDDAYISTFTSKSEKKNLKRGKGSQKKSKVTVMTESFPLEDEHGKRVYYCGNLKMKVNKDDTKSSMNYITQNNIRTDSILFSDQAHNFNDLNELFEANFQTNSKDIKWDIDFKWINIAIANVKRFILGIYHIVKEKYLQLYLDEFCYKLNRRYSKNKFEMLIYDIL